MIVKDNGGDDVTVILPPYILILTRLTMNLPVSTSVQMIIQTIYFINLKFSKNKMKNLKLFMGMLMMATLVMFTSCDNNDDPAQEIPVEQVGDVSFDLTNYANLASKGTAAKDHDPADIICSDEDPDYVWVTIRDAANVVTEYKVDIVGNGMETKVFKMDAGFYTIEDFAVYDDAGTPLDDTDDVPIYASPETNSPVAIKYSLSGVEKVFEVKAFEKTKYDIDVLCYVPAEYEDFGFTWFQFAKYQVKHVCFYGNVCTKFFEQFHADVTGNLYAGQPYDGYDFAAIFRIDIKDSQDVIVSSADNFAWQGVGDPLCVDFIDNLQVVGETFTAEIWLQLPDGTEILVDSVAFDESTYSDDEAPVEFGGEDGVYDFYVGDCLVDDSTADAVYPSYIPLPDTVTMKISGGATTYVDIDILSIDANPLGNQLPVGVLAGWCGDKFSNISAGTTYTANVYSSLDIVGMPSDYAAYGNKWNILNWIINNVDLAAKAQESGMTIQKVQNGLWKLIHDNDGTIGGDGGLMASLNIDVTNLANVAQSIKEYKPQVGDWAFVLLDPIEGVNKDMIQLMVVQVDP